MATLEAPEALRPSDHITSHHVIALTVHKVCAQAGCLCRLQELTFKGLGVHKTALQQALDACLCTEAEWPGEQPFGVSAGSVEPIGQGSEAGECDQAHHMRAHTGKGMLAL